MPSISFLIVPNICAENASEVMANMFSHCKEQVILVGHTAGDDNGICTGYIEISELYTCQFLEEMKESKRTRSRGIRVVHRDEVQNEYAKKSFVPIARYCGKDGQKKTDEALARSTPSSEGSSEVSPRTFSSIGVLDSSIHSEKEFTVEREIFACIARSEPSIPSGPVKSPAVFTLSALSTQSAPPTTLAPFTQNASLTSSESPSQSIPQTPSTQSTPRTPDINVLPPTPTKTSSRGATEESDSEDSSSFQLSEECNTVKSAGGSPLHSVNYEDCIEGSSSQEMKTDCTKELNSPKQHFLKPPSKHNKIKNFLGFNKRKSNERSPPGKGIESLHKDASKPIDTKGQELAKEKSPAFGKRSRSSILSFSGFKSSVKESGESSKKKEAFSPKGKKNLGELESAKENEDSSPILEKSRAIISSPKPGCSSSVPKEEELDDIDSANVSKASDLGKKSGILLKSKSTSKLKKIFGGSRRASSSDEKSVAILKAKVQESDVDDVVEPPAEVRSHKGEDSPKCFNCPFLF